MSDFFSTNLNLDDWDVLLKKDELAEEPVPISTFVQDRKYLGLPELSDIQTEIIRYSTQVLKPETLVKLMGEDEGLLYHRKYTVNEVVAQLGKGSGKDHCSRIAQAYIVYLMHCLRDPLDYYNKAHGVSIDLVNLAVNAKQAQQVFFDPLKNVLMASPWANEVGFEPRVQEIFWFERPVRMFSGHSESEGWEGYEVLSVVLDEISAFKTSIELKGDQRAKGSADQIYNMARASVVSRFPNVGKVVLLSFPRFKGDFIQQRYDAVVDENKREETAIDTEFGVIGRKTWAIKAATWEVNPARTKEDFDDEFYRNPIDARARFMCEPPEMVDAYFKDADSVRNAFSRHDDPMEEDGTFKKWFTGTDGYTRYIHVDLGLKRDRTGLAMVHSPGLKEVNTYMGVERLPVVNVDFVHAWQAGHGEEINYSQVRSMIVDLCRKFEVASVTLDMWQSADIIQSLRSNGINADWHTVKKSDYDTLSTCIYDGRLRGYWNPLLVEDELLKLKLLSNNKVDHPTTGCFVGETRIPLPDGRSKMISELDGKEITVFSCDKKGRVVEGVARGRKTTETKYLIDVVLDNGSTTRCTPNHQWMMDDGTYKHAQDLIPIEDRLMPIRLGCSKFGVSDDRARRIRHLIHIVLDEAVPVYDLEVDEYHNFALQAGVFVHNSKDLADAVAGATMMCIENFVSDSEIEIEILDDSLDFDDEEEIVAKITKPKAEEIPEELQEWLEII